MEKTTFICPEPVGPTRLSGRATRRDKIVPPTVLYMLIALCGLYTGCPTSAPVPAQSMVEQQEFQYQKVAVLPFVRMESEEGDVRGPVTGEVYDTCPISERAESTLWSLLENELDGRPDIKRVPSYEVRRTAEGLSIEESLNLRMDGKYQLSVARKVGADVALFGFVYCFRERTGTAYASREPASVGFNLVLVDVQTGKLLWKARFEELQQPLSENVAEVGIFIQRGAKFVTAEALAQEGIRIMVQKLPGPASLGGAGNP